MVLPVGTDSNTPFLPPGVSPDAPVVPYGMGDCRTFMNVPPLAHWDDGTVCLNPDRDAVHGYWLVAKGRDPALAGDASLVTSVPIAPNETAQLQMSLDREENGLGHFLIKDFVLLTNPASARGLEVSIKTLQGDKVFMNAPVFNTLIMGDAQLSACIPCPIMLFPNQALIFTVRNRELVDTRVTIVARGRRFLPYHDMKLAAELERCWSLTRSSPFWLTFDDTQVLIPAAVGDTPGEATAQMTVPGGGWFEMGRPRCDIFTDIPGAADADDIGVLVTEGRIGKRFMDGEVRLGSHWATPTLSVAGFPGNLYRAASIASACETRTMIRGNTRLVHKLYNYSNVAVFVRITYPGCLHFADMCPPRRDLDLVRRFGTANVPALLKAFEEGDSFMDVWHSLNPLVMDESAINCPPPAGEPCPPDTPGYDEASYAHEPAAEPARIVNVWRPGKTYYGPGSTGALPGHLAFGADQYGRTYLVTQTPNGPQVVNPSDGPPWAAQFVAEKNAQAGLSGLGKAPQGEWEAI